jgi:hypothetical protein
MSAADLVAQLAAAGTPPELLAAVAQELFCGEAERRALADRRKSERDRKANQRSKSREVTGQAVKSRDPAPNERDNLTPTRTPIVISNEITPPAENNDQPELKPEHVVEAWNDLAVRHGLAVVKKLTPERRKKLSTFIRRHSIDDITEAIAAIPKSPFLLGENQRGWRANFDWFLEPRNLTKLSEATYVH